MDGVRNRVTVQHVMGSMTLTITLSVAGTAQAVADGVLTNKAIKSIDGVLRRHSRDRAASMVSMTLIPVGQINS